MSTRLRWGIALLIWLATVLLIAAFYWDARQRTLTIAAGPASGESFRLATTIAEVLEDTGLDIHLEVYETRGSSENVRLLETGQVDLGTISNNTVIRGGVSAVASLYSDVFQLVVVASELCDRVDL